MNPIKQRTTGRRWPRGRLALLCGAVMAASFTAIVPLPALRGLPLTRFLPYFLLAAVAYAAAVTQLNPAPPLAARYLGFCHPLPADVAIDRATNALG